MFSFFIALSKDILKVQLFIVSCVLLPADRWAKVMNTRVA